jgi:hypothetical protein
LLRKPYAATTHVRKSFEPPPPDLDDVYGAQPGCDGRRRRGRAHQDRHARPAQGRPQ